MIESFKHFESISDKKYNDYKVNKEDCLNYKKYINEISKIIHFSDINEEILKIIIKQNLDKYSKISKYCLENYNQYLAKFSQEKLLKIQLDSLNNKNNIYVLNTSLFWGIDYFGKEKFDYYNNIII